jgi:hypothetical protein
MIVVSSSVVLTDDYGANANSPVFGVHTIVTIGNVVADGEDEDHPATNVANPATFNYWLGENDDAQNLTVTTGYVDDLDYLAVAGHNFGTAAIAVKVQGQYEDAGAWSDLTSEFIPADDRPIIFRFDPQSLHGVRLVMAAGDAIPRVAVLYVGKLMVMPRRTYVGHAPITYTGAVEATNGQSESGQFLGRIVTGETFGTAFSFDNLTASWVRTFLVPFLDLAKEEPFFFAWRPSTYPRETGFGWLTGPAIPRNSRSNGMMAVDLQIGGLGR